MKLEAVEFLCKEILNWRITKTGDIFAWNIEDTPLLGEIPNLVS